MNTVTKNKLADNLVIFFKKYLDQGLSISSGKELELMVFELYIKTHPEFINKSSFEKSRILKTSDRKIKNMLYELRLRKEDTPDKLISYINENIDSVEVQNGKVTLECDDIYFEKKIKSLLKDFGYISDTSFNKELLKIPLRGFLYLIAELYRDREEAERVNKIIASKEFKESSENIWKSLNIPGTSIQAKDILGVLTNLKKYVGKLLRQKRTT